MTATESELDYRASRVRRLGVPPGTRDIRIVHELDGILDPVSPEDLLRIGHALWNTWTDHPRFAQPDLILGLDAGGIPPTVAVSLAAGLPYRLAWKLDLQLPDKHQFSEPHARRTDVFTYGDLVGQRVLVVDDEVTTGRTLSSLVTVLRGSGVDIVGIACLVEDTSSHPRRVLAEQEVALCTLTRI